MGLTCECFCSDFDKGDYDSWWEPGCASVPPSGMKCCECGAPLPAEECACIRNYEVYEPDGTDAAPRHPWSAEGDESVTSAEFLAIEAAWDEWAARTGWEDEYDRYERETGADYRCDRCAGLAASIEDLGYCLIRSGELIECHGDFIHEHGYAPRLWRAGADGIFNPHPWRRQDYVAAWVRRMRHRTSAWFRYGWKSDLRYKVWWPIRRRFQKITKRLGSAA